jgi:hypothetical protein
MVADYLKDIYLYTYLQYFLLYATNISFYIMVIAVISLMFYLTNHVFYFSMYSELGALSKMARKTHSCIQI